MVRGSYVRALESAGSVALAEHLEREKLLYSWQAGTLRHMGADHVPSSPFKGIPLLT